MPPSVWLKDIRPSARARSAGALTRWVLSLGFITLGPGVLAQPGNEPATGELPDVASHDWTPRTELTPEQQARVPVYCPGAYVQPPLPGQASDTPGAEADDELPVRTFSNQARYEVDEEAVLTGNVEIIRGPFRVQSEAARYDQLTGEISLSGSVLSRGDGFALAGSDARYDVESGQMVLNTANFLLHPAAMRGTAGSLTRRSQSVFEINEGSFTTCEPGNNAWAIRASDVVLDRESGVGEARHVRLEVKDVPVFYWPYMTFPIDERRKSGFLYPAFGTSNTGRGIFAAVPYYFNLAPNYDATLTPQYIHGRGVLTEVEGRYLSRWGASILTLGYIPEDEEYRRDQPGEDGERWGLGFNSAAYLGGGWSGNIDYSAVSDEDYLGDLNRNLDINQATHLQRLGRLQYAQPDRYFEALVSGYQTLDRDISRANRPYYQLPELLYGQTLGDEVVFNWESQYTYFWRDNEGLSGRQRAVGNRLRLLPELALDLRQIWGYTRPSVLLDFTYYSLEDYEFGSGDFSRTVPFFEWDNGLYFDRHFSLFGAPYTQSLEPRLYYVYSPAREQDQIPDFDTSLASFYFGQLFQRDRFVGGDRVGDNNRLTAALTTRFYSLDTGMERARLSLAQVYYYDEREVGLDGLGTGTRSDSALAGELALRPSENLEARVSGLWDPRDYSTQQGRSELVFHSDDYRWLLNLGHTYDDDDLEQSDIGAVFPLSNSLSAVGRWVYDIADERTVGSLAGFEYSKCCWSIQVVAQRYLKTNEEVDSRILFQIQLTGLGGGGSADGRIGDAIFGYEERQRRREQMTPAFGRF